MSNDRIKDKSEWYNLAAKGLVVVTVNKLTASSEYSNEGNLKRKPNTKCKIVDFSDGHGFCYGVIHSEGFWNFQRARNKEVVWYNPEELLFNGNPLRDPRTKSRLLY